MDQADSPGPGAPTDGEGRRRRIKPSMLVFACLVAAAAAFGLYEMARPGGKVAAHTGTCATSLDLAQQIDPLVHGEVAALTLATQAHPLADIAFDDPNGHKTTIGAFKGRTVLLNLWATWCAPCRAEMPALNALQGALGSGAFTVVPVNVDVVRLDKPKAFMKEIAADNLPLYADNTADILQSLKASVGFQGLPTTVLIGPDGCEIGTLGGAAVWDSPDARALIERVEKGPEPAKRPV